MPSIVYAIFLTAHAIDEAMRSTPQAANRFREIALTTLVLCCFPLGVTYGNEEEEEEEEDCSKMECMTVVGKRITCDDGMICSSSPPESLMVDCYNMIVDYDNPPLSGKFGESRDNGPHNGIDLAVPTGTPIHSAKKGVVRETEDRFSEGDKSTPNGNFVRIDYVDGTQGVFIHMLKVHVTKDQSVAAGEKIGTSDDTGHSKGPHLHYTQYDETETPVSPMDVHDNC